MTGFEELKMAYELMRKECSFHISDIIVNDIDGDKEYELVFKFFGVGIRMSFSYKFFIEGDPFRDDILFEGDPGLHFSIFCFRVITDFIETLQAHRADKDAMDAFTKYLKEQCDSDGPVKGDRWDENL